jgi:hypothetical protein
MSFEQIECTVVVIHLTLQLDGFQLSHAFTTCFVSFVYARKIYRLGLHYGIK